MSPASRLAGFSNDGLRFDVIDVGPIDGPVIIALHGFPELATMWDGVIPHLTAAGFRVLAPNQRGYSPGARPIGVKNYTLDRLADDVVALADQCGAPEFHVLGHDWGAVVAWHLVARHPERAITASMLSVPHPRAMLAAMPRGQLLRSGYILLCQLPWLPEWINRAGDGWALRRIGAPVLKMSDQLIAQTRALFDEPGAATAIVNWYRGLRYPPRLAVRRIAVPTLYVWSTDDAAIGRAAAERAANYVDGPYRMKVLDGVSHWIVEERPAQTAAMVLEHIGSHTQSGGGVSPVGG